MKIVSDLAMLYPSPDGTQDSTLRLLKAGSEFIALDEKGKWWKIIAVTDRGRGGRPELIEGWINIEQVKFSRAV